MKDDSIGKLEVVRTRIDEIDRELAKLLNERAACAERVATIKKTDTDPESSIFYRPEREAQILRRVSEENTGPLADDHITRLFREIISCCLSLEQSLTIAYLGPEGTFTEAAVIKQFGNFVSHSAQLSIDDVFREVESGSTHYGVVPVENSTEGMVNLTLDCLMKSKLNIIGEIEMPIHHAFMSVGESEAITTIYSHEQSLAQCRRWLDRHYPSVPREAVVSNAEAARVALQTESAAAIAGEMAADRYGLRVLAANIEDEPDNKTRFLVIGKESIGPSGRDKTSILVSTRNEPGALYGVLEPFHRHGVDLTRIEARPSRSGNWNYVFFIDFNGHQSIDEIKVVLQEVGKVATEVRSLGSYPQAVL